jgi:hypothetical protein
MISFIFCHDCFYFLQRPFYDDREWSYLIGHIRAYPLYYYCLFMLMDCMPFPICLCWFCFLFLFIAHGLRETIVPRSRSWRWICPNSSRSLSLSLSNFYFFYFFYFLKKKKKEKRWVGSVTTCIWFCLFLFFFFFLIRSNTRDHTFISLLSDSVDVTVSINHWILFCVTIVDWETDPPHFKLNGEEPVPYFIWGKIVISHFEIILPLIK